MKPNNKREKKKQKVKKKPIVKTKKERVLVVAQEFKFALLLSGNEKKTRDRVLKALKKWLHNCFGKEYEFKEDDFIRVWKGLFYAVWMSDKLLIQEELCESISSILDLFPKEQIKNAVLMTKAGLKVLATEWYGIDQHRMDKFLMLIRRYLRGSLRCLLRCNWSLESCNMYAKMLSAQDGILAIKTPTYARNSMSMILHFIDCFLEELAKVSEGQIPDESIVCLLRPFSTLVCGGETLSLCVAARRLLTALVRQSELGLQYSDAEYAWQKMGCPPGGPDALELEIEEEDDSGTHGDADADEDSQPSAAALDPRAGRVDVVLPLLPVPAALLAEDLRLLMDATGCASKAYKRAKICLQRFEQLCNNEYPLRVKDTDFAAEPEEPLPKPEEAAERLRDLEKKLITSADELALRGLRRKHRKRLLAKSRAGLSIVDDVAAAAESTKDDWQTDEQSDEQKKEKDSSNKENQAANKKRQNKKRKLNRDPKESGKVKKIKTESNNQIQEPKTRLAINKLKNGLSENNTNLTKSKNKNIAAKRVKAKESNKKSVVASKRKKDLISKDNSETLNAKVKVNAATEIRKDKAPIKPAKASVLVNKVNNRKNQVPLKSANKAPSPKLSLGTPKKVKFVLKNNGIQGPVDYYKSVRQNPNIPFDSSKQPSKTNLKPSMPSPINPFLKKKLKLKKR